MQSIAAKYLQEQQPNSISHNANIWHQRVYYVKRKKIPVTKCYHPVSIEILEPVIPSPTLLSEVICHVLLMRLLNSCSCTKCQVGPVRRVLDFESIQGFNTHWGNIFAGIFCFHIESSKASDANIGIIANPLKWYWGTHVMVWFISVAQT